MNILIGTVLIGALAIWLFRALPEDRRSDAFGATRDTLAFTLPRVTVALIGAGFFAELLPAEQMQALFGSQSGLWGLILASVMGPITPGGPFVSFAIGAAALQSGASVATVMAYVTAWSLFSLTKLLGYEWPIMGPAATGLRVLVSVWIPVAVGAAVMWIWPG